MKRLQDELRRADMTIASLNSELSTLKWEGQHARYAVGGRAGLGRCGRAGAAHRVVEQTKTATRPIQLHPGRAALNPAPPPTQLHYVCGGCSTAATTLSPAHCNSPAPPLLLQMDALERHLNGSRKENASLQRAAAKAERHLDAYDRVSCPSPLLAVGYFCAFLVNSCAAAYSEGHLDAYDRVS